MSGEEKFLIGFLLVVGAVIIASDPRCKTLCQRVTRAVAQQGLRRMFLA
jgi:hypothetical protein